MSESVIEKMARLAAVAAGWIQPDEWESMSGDIGDGLFTQQDWREAVRAALSAAAEAEWVLVPKKPTDEMWTAGLPHLDSHSSNMAWWRAMLEKAPKP